MVKKVKKVKKDNKLKMIDLCAGTGAFKHAFENTNKVEAIYSNDIELASQKIYNTNFNHKLTLGDLNNMNIIDIPSHDIMTCGFPCQSYSIAGNRKGFDDPDQIYFGNY
jgi:DNA (cytosine-5)-methyltransferase 1